MRSLPNAMRLPFLLVLVLPILALANVPHEDAVPAYSAEQTVRQIEQDVPEPGWTSSASGKRHMARNYISSTIDEPTVILPRGGNTWRTLRNGPIAFWSAVLLIGVLVLVAAFYFIVGPTGLKGQPTGRKILRFTGFQRLVHWTTAIVFLVLAFTGLIIMYGKELLIPLLGHDFFSSLAAFSKWLHDFAGPLFVVLSILMFFTFLRENFFKRYDWHWIKGGGGLISKRHIPAGKFNAGEKLWFWGGVTFLGLLISASGLVLDFTNFGQTRYIIQWANYVHIFAAMLYMIATIGHIYMGTIGNEGAYRAMRDGTIDEQWAKEHHELWYDEIKRRGDQDVPPPRRAGASPRPQH